MSYIHRPHVQDLVLADTQRDPSSVRCVTKGSRDDGRESIEIQESGVISDKTTVTWGRSWIGIGHHDGGKAASKFRRDGHHDDLKCCGRQYQIRGLDLMFSKERLR